MNIEKINKLIKRNVIRNDKFHEFLNKMTDDEISELDEEINIELSNEGVEKVFPVWNAAVLAKYIDYSILYDIIKLK